MSIIVKNGFVSGFSTMMMNLISSSSSFYNSEIKETPWMLEYIHGASQEIYVVHIPEDFSMKIPFGAFVQYSYLEYGSLVIGIKKKREYQLDRDIFYFLYLLNPLNDYILSTDDELIMISTDLEATRAVFNETNFKKFISTKNENSTYVKMMKISDEKWSTFYGLFHNESYAIKEKDSVIDNVKNNDNDDENDDSNPASHYFKNSNILTNNSHLEDSFQSYSSIKTKVIRKKINIPEIFLKKQHFKIWENNTPAFDKQLNNHYIIFCKEEHLWEFMICFDQYYNETIFFVSDQHPSSKWDIIRKYFCNLIYIECSYSDQDDLAKLKIDKAKHIFILTWAVENSNVNDSGILPLVKIIEENFPTCKYTLELSDDLNVRYLNNRGINKDGPNPRSSIKKIKYGNLSKARRMSQLHKDEMNSAHKKSNEKIPVRIWPKYAKSDIFFSSSLESLLAFSYHNEGLLDVLTKLLGISEFKDEKFPENGNLSMFRYVGKEKYSYDNLFNYFVNLENPIIPIAIYRYFSDEDKIEEKNELKHESSYIITNPKKELMLNTFDKVICLGKPLTNNKFPNFDAEMLNEEQSFMSNISNSFNLLEGIEVEDKNILKSK